MSYLKKLQAKQAARGFLSEAASLPMQPKEEEDASPLDRALRGAPVGTSRDLIRIINLPSRELVFSDEIADKWTDILRRPAGKCDCVAKWGFCIDRLNVTQAAAFEEMSKAGGLLGLIGVGFGKSGIGILSAMVLKASHAVLLIPPALRRQMVERDLHQWAVHFQIPNVTGFEMFYPNIKPRLTIVAYSELSQAKNSDLLQRVPTDLIIADEAHNLKDKKSARTKRFLRAISERPAKFVALSGTMSSRSLKDYGHLSRLALGEGSPLPLHQPTLEEWASALDASPFQAPAGALWKLCKQGEEPRDGFGRRLVTTPGVVATTSASVSCSLEFNAVKLAVPANIEALMDGVRETAQRPDGEEAMEALMQAAWLRQLSSGFYYKWVYPRGEPREVIEDWFDARKKYFKEVREKLKTSQTFLDSPLNLAKAAIRWHDGYSHDGKEYPRGYKKGPLPSWPSAHFPKWREVRHSVVHETEPVWESDFVVKAVKDWASKHVGLIWVEHKCLGERIAAELGLPYYGGGDINPELSEDGSRCAVLSIKANKDGKNLQRFSRNLIVNPVTNGKDWEQMVGRTHRQGQKADTVYVDILLHTPENAKALDKAMEEARYMQATKHGPQKLCYADFSFLLSDFLEQ